MKVWDSGDECDYGYDFYDRYDYDYDHDHEHDFNNGYDHDHDHDHDHNHDHTYNYNHDYTNDYHDNQHNRYPSTFPCALTEIRFFETGQRSRDQVSHVCTITPSPMPGDVRKLGVLEYG